MNHFSAYLAQNGGLVLAAFWQQLALCFITFALAFVLGVPLGLLCYRNERLKRPLMSLVNLLQTLPALALFGLVVAAGGRTGTGPALFLALLYTLLPIIFGTEKGFRGIGRPAIDAAMGMGLSRSRTLFSVMLPLASGQIMRGLRKGAVSAVGMVTMATLAGGGLGSFILDGIRTHNTAMILAGALPACLLAVAADLVLALLFKAIVPAPLRRTPEPVLFLRK